MRRQGDFQGGFTLIELLVVIIVLGILSAIVVFAVRGADDKGKTAAVATDERTIRTAMEVFCGQNNRYPGGPEAGEWATNPMGELVAGKYLSNPSEYHTLSTGDNNKPGDPPNLYPEGKCAGSPTNYLLNCTNTPCGTGGDPSLPPEQSFRAVSAGSTHSLRLTTDGKVFASGSNSRGALGVGDFSVVDSLLPVQVKGGASGTEFLEGVKAVAAGSGQSVALRNDGTVWSWGSNNSGNLGTGAPRQENASAPVQVKGENGSGFLTGVAAIAMPEIGDHVLALKEDGTVWAWGDNLYGQLGTGSSGADAFTPVRVKGENGSGFLSGVTAIDAGYGHSLALVGDKVWSWGRNAEGQLGDGTLTSRTTPVQVQNLGGGPVTAISSGENHSVALKADKTVWQWGSIALGSNVLVPTQVIGLEGITAIAAGADHNLASKGGEAWAWGQNAFGELGDNSKTDRMTAVQVKGFEGVGFLVGVVALSGGRWYSMAAMADGRVLTWGYSPLHLGQLGLGHRVGSLVPTDRSVPTPPNDAYISAVVLTGTSGSVTGTNRLATKEHLEPSHKPGPASGGTSVWYRWTAGTSGVVTFTTAGSSFNTTMGVYIPGPRYSPACPDPGRKETLDPSESCTATPVGQNDDFLNNQWSQVEAPVTAGTEYYIAIDGSSLSDYGPIKLAWSLSTGGP